MTAGAIRTAGLRLEPTGRNPRHYDLCFDELDARIERFGAVNTPSGSTPTMNLEHRGPEEQRVTELDVDLVADLNAQDDDGLGWTTLAEAREPDRVHCGALLLAGNRSGRAVVRVVAVDDDGQVHFEVLPGSIAKNRHLIEGTLA